MTDPYKRLRKPIKPADKPIRRPGRPKNQQPAPEPRPALAAAQAMSPYSRLAFELAIKLRPVPEICEMFGLQASDLVQLLKNNAQFRDQIRAYSAEWSSSLSAEDRVKLKSAAMAEDGLMDLWNLFTNPETRDDLKLEVHKHLVKLGSVQAPAPLESGGSKFSVTINIPSADADGSDKKLTVDAAALPVDED